jgi:hypothetical protein
MFKPNQPERQDENNNINHYKNEDPSNQYPAVLMNRPLSEVEERVLESNQQKEAIKV